ncbi:structural maintenance of chromosomes flexible hinge domain-containing protein 1 [Elysia marginata]|uniref:Structural maintenance of chromosomes flexible hinge domain-containing protein 1 n=1 Tax=Elysia marginata TaxID=1093978 RepID=A0AAV4HLE4_9GAST|nr:structural maintenance of chromosomes flexible hinge domain-containing protein 1 [Elysia marginata]
MLPDARKQQQMSALSKERDALRGTVQAYKSMFDTQQQLINELRAAAVEAKKEEQVVRAELRKQNIPGNNLVSVDVVNELIHARTRDRELVLHTPRRTCGLSAASDEAGILGKLGHLAMVQEDDIARVLSWHMAADMDCVITHTTAKAKDVYHKTQGRQQVLPLDSIFKKNLPDWNKPLPLERHRPGFQAGGNPVYARNLLEFPKEEDSCRIVFGMLLGDTLILDSLDHANLYRQELVKFTHCPTILTRDGDRIRSNGKFGGAMNKAPPIEKLKGCVFGQPLPLTYHAICTQIETLERFKSALSSSAVAQEELQEQIEFQKLPETTAKMKEFKDAEQRLREVETKLGMNLPIKTPFPSKTPSRTPATPSRTPATPSRTSFTPRSGTLRASSSKDSVSEPALKKPKIEPGLASSPRTQQSRRSNVSQSPSTVVAGSSDTPPRSSRRIASMTPVVSEDGRKRLKKST